MAADTASRMPAAITPNTPKACLAIDAPFMSAGPRERPAEFTVRGSAQKLLPRRLERLSSGLSLDAPNPLWAARASLWPIAARGGCRTALIQLVAEAAG